jgi:hypothetical protein
MYVDFTDSMPHVAGREDWFRPSTKWLKVSDVIATLRVPPVP